MSVLARRIAAQGLASRSATTLDVLRSWTVQDSPPGAAATAIAARARTVTLDEALAGRDAVALYNPRTATAILPSDEAAAFATALIDPDEGEEARIAVEAISAALDRRTLSRDDLHEELRGRLPEEMLPWCDGCGSHHARRWVLVTAGLHGRLCIAGRAGRQPAFARTDQWIDWDAPPREEAGAELVRRFRVAYGPSSSADFAAWAGIEGPHARALWDLVPAEAEPKRAPGRAKGVRLLAPGDPLLLRPRPRRARPRRGPAPAGVPPDRIAGRRPVRRGARRPVACPQEGQAARGGGRGARQAGPRSGAPRGGAHRPATGLHRCGGRIGAFVGRGCGKPVRDRRGPATVTGDAVRSERSTRP
jgi:hypothetical protein